MTFLLGASDPHQAAKRAWQPAGEDVQTGQRYSRIERPQSIVRRTHQHGPGLDSRGAVPAAVRTAHFVLHQCKRKGDYCMSTVTSQNQTAPVVRQYEIRGVRYIVKATVKDGAKETAVKKIRRLLQNDLNKAAT